MCLISIIRVVMILQNLKSTDPSWDFVYIANWNSIEVNSAIVISCLIVLKPLLRKLVPRLFTADQDPILGEEYKVSGGEVAGNEKQLLGSVESGPDADSQASSSGRIGHMA